ncbi:MAG: hypothetical protein OXQ92_14450 [Boseongicola sp.]|nr:hypothetical protein [Boseongicola sp.]MDD9978215.1 hypothetical protein [Boseongicola sp.]
MDPTHILAASGLPQSSNPDDIDAFYEEHGLVPFARFKAIAAVLHRAASRVGTVSATLEVNLGCSTRMVPHAKL